ncbi:tRNA preQ1(34) S-adenosylmethionine ribosyltransferase-isomerase QueA [Kordiimonas marina]|uniref:tRNA preQ1(34) S-adenosylmethionine ribosyltransferase-isomerase QueA n=1 Tax=Kordiimonas marina TaxID=2872312 RepID=UPI001FF19338|nr:tRNA preQ1(34) S-adenosylmethionine ribosyltransferase-isomerase QueA [Kordiimonas marina]MCJ9428872.1 tRNA preQ1(34) S-adenosylmethionine ribosyltransferase-isomerase QueA [Kordiimonas marina]
MDVNLFDFVLPKDHIALRPARPRDAARMLVVGPNGDEHKTVLDLADYLTDKDVLVFNDTRVIPGRLSGKRGEANVEVTLHKRESETVWRVFARPARKCRMGDVLNFSGLEAEVIGLGDEGERTLNFRVEGAEMTSALESHGVMPLPPYIASQRDIDEADKSDYQTLFAKQDGAVAAPTAGLHFTPRMIEKLEAKGVERLAVTLHVGAGTFLPVKAENTDDHKMHSEWGEVSPEVAARLNEARAKGGRIVAVGTTSLRLLESAATEDGIIKPFMGDTDIFITPGYKFRAVDILMTNFHLPKSTLFMLVSAFAGLERMQAAYKTAVDENYRFYSYGDSSLLFRAE